MPFAKDGGLIAAVGLLGFVSPPPLLLAIAIGITILYGVGMEIVKQIFFRNFATGRYFR